MSLTYAINQPVTLQQLQPLMEQTSWMKGRTEADVQKMQQHSLCITVWREGQLIAFGRAITDGVYRAFIEDIVVDQQHRHQQVGQSLVRKLLEQLQHVEEVQLGCVDELVTFYQQLGFVRSDQPKMILRRSNS